MVRTNTAPLPPAALASRAANRQMLPQKPGTILGSMPKAVAQSPTLTPLEQQMLEGAGWQNGDPIPDLTKTAAGRRLAAQAHAVAVEAENMQGLTPVPPDTPPIVVPPIRDIGSLPLAQQQDLYQSMTEMQELKQQLNMARVQQTTKSETVEEYRGDMRMAQIPGLLEAKRVAEAAVASQQATPAFVDDIGMFDPTKRRPAVPAQVQVPPAPVPQPVQPVSSSAAEKPVTVTPTAPTICPHCKKASNAPQLEITQTDKLTYISTIVGGHRFVKQYAFYGGRIVATFRSLLTVEHDMILNQLDDDVNAGRIVTPTQWHRMLTEYKLATSLQRYIVGTQTYDLLPIAEVDYDRSEYTTPLPQLLAYVNTTTLPTDEVRRTVIAAWTRFDELLTTLESKAQDSSFYGAIETLV